MNETIDDLRIMIVILLLLLSGHFLTKIYNCTNWTIELPKAAIARRVAPSRGGVTGRDVPLPAGVGLGGASPSQENFSNLQL